MAAPNPNAGVPWDQTPEYIALTDHVIPPGGQTGYTQLHPAGASPTDVTAFVYGQRDIRVGNWPEVMYMLLPTAEWEAFKKSGPPQQKQDANQQPMFERWPRVGEQARPLLDFPILPDSISSREELWRFDVWRKMDPRMSWDDLTMRIELHGRTQESDLKLQNSIQTMLGRFWHKHYHQISWLGKGRFHFSNVNNPARIKLLNDLARANIPLNLNTTKGLTPGSFHRGAGSNATMVPWPNVRGGTIRRSRTAAATPAPVVPVTAIVAAPVIPLVTAPVRQPAIASVATVTAEDDAKRDSDMNYAISGNGREDTDALIESNGDLSVVDDSAGSASATSESPEDEGDEKDKRLGEVSDSEGEWSSTDGHDEETPVYSFDSGLSFDTNTPATPKNKDSGSNFADDPYAAGFMPIEHTASVPDNDGNTTTSSSSEPQAKRPCTGSGIHSDAVSHMPTAVNDVQTIASAEHVAPPFQRRATSMPDLPPSHTPGLANLSEPCRESAGLSDTSATDSDSTSDATRFFRESGELPPDGSCY